jgi:hypothetical protein
LYAAGVHLAVFLGSIRQAQHNFGRNISILAATNQEICHGQHISWFCDLYRTCAGRLTPRCGTLRQVHVAGERLFVDFAGHTSAFGNLLAKQGLDYLVVR